VPIYTLVNKSRQTGPLLNKKYEVLTDEKLDNVLMQGLNIPLRNVLGCLANDT
jgi:hypothetical protein